MACPIRIVRVRRLQPQRPLGNYCRWLGVLTAAVALGCSKVLHVVTFGAYAEPYHPLFPTWEPTADAVPAVADRELARSYLKESRSLWQYIKLKGHGLEDGQSLEDARAAHAQSHNASALDYVYVRALQLDARQVRFTVFVVYQDRVVRRAWFGDDPLLMAMNRSKETPLPVAQWEELGSAVGTHSEGAAPVTIDALYDRCEQVLGTHAELPVHLNFHQDGVLQHCGFLADDCRDCGSVSIQTYSLLHPYDRFPTMHQTPLDYLCTDQVGLHAAGKTSVLSDYCSCWERIRDPLPVTTEGFEDICKIDPAACPGLVPRSAAWVCKDILVAEHQWLKERSAYFWPSALGRPTPRGPVTRVYDASKKLRIQYYTPDFVR